MFEFKTSDLFTEREKAGLQVAVQAGMGPKAVDAEHMSEWSKHFSEKQVIESVGVISLFG